ncbi:hypothetical protein BKA57DRAFT_474035 [Linnemannia elongata]|nr:hypothetical protein BKA57DRAFT_474035 [Linnemannia elongata]
MDPLSQLPLECLQHILAILAQQNNSHALAALLCTNKNIAFLTLPFLYADPYRPSTRLYTNGEWRAHKRHQGASHGLTRILLDRVPAARLPFLLRFALQVTSTSQETNTSISASPPIDYCAHIRHLNMDKDSINIDKYWSQENPSPRLLEFVTGAEFERLCGLDRILPTYYGNFGKERHLRQFYRVILFREATWTLGEPIFEQLQSLTIPISMIEQYLGVVSRLERLERIRFLLDALFDYKSSYVWSAALEELMFPIDDLKNQAMHSAMQFVKEHAQLFPGQLAGGVSFVDGEFWVDAPQGCPRDIQLEVARLLPPLRDVSSVTDENWAHFAAHISSTDLGQVETIVNRDFGRDAVMSLGLVIDDGDERPFLQRCRGLRSLEMVADGSRDRFKWAVEEKRQALSRANNGLGFATVISGGVGASGTTMSLQQQQQLRSVPLTKFTLTEQRHRIVREMYDITFAFNQTLTHLTIFANFDSHSTAFQFGFGRVELPVLTHLILSTTREVAVIDEQFPRRCPNLKFVTFSDKTFHYRPENIVTNALAHLPHLEHLDLMGTSALKFHPATLDSTPNLVSLCMGIIPMHGIDHNDVFIPDIEELNRSFGIQNDSDNTNNNNNNNQNNNNNNSTLSASEEADTDMEGAEPGRNVRPQWSWNWEFLQLRNLHLTGEFAFLFEFRMLRGCPALETLALEIQSNSYRFRAITPLDLRPAPLHPPRDINRTRLSVSSATTTTTTTEMTVLPRLRTLRLKGSWAITQPVLSDLLLKTCPELEVLHLEGWKAGSLAGLIDLVRTMYERTGKMQELRVGMHRVNGLTIEKMRVIGMFPVGHPEMVGKDVLPIEVHAPRNQDAWFSILRKCSGGSSGSEAKL